MSETSSAAKKSITTVPVVSRMVHVKRIDDRISANTRSLTYVVKAGNRIIELSQQELFDFVEIANTFLIEKGDQL